MEQVGAGSSALRRHRWRWICAHLQSSDLSLRAFPEFCPRACSTAPGESDWQTALVPLSRTLRTVSGCVVCQPTGQTKGSDHHCDHGICGFMRLCQANESECVLLFMCTRTLLRAAHAASSLKHPACAPIGRWSALCDFPNLRTGLLHRGEPSLFAQ